MSVQNEKLIEEARAGLAAFDEYWGAGAPVNPEHGRPWELIRGLLSVFEKAHAHECEKLIEEARATMRRQEWAPAGLLIRLADALEAAEKAHAHECEMCRWENGFGARKPLTHTCEKIADAIRDGEI